MAPNTLLLALVCADARDGYAGAADLCAHLALLCRQFLLDKSALGTGVRGRQSFVLCCFAAGAGGWPARFAVVIAFICIADPSMMTWLYS